MKMCLSLFLAVLLAHSMSFNLTAKADPRNLNPKEAAKAAQQSAKIKAGIQSLGAGQAARIQLKLRDNTKYKGYISEVSDNHFVVVDEKTGASARVAYPEVKSVKGNNFSSGTKLGIGLGLAALAAIIIVAVAVRRNDNDGEVIRPPCSQLPC